MFFSHLNQTNGVFQEFISGESSGHHAAKIPRLCSWDTAASLCDPSIGSRAIPFRHQSQLPSLQYSCFIMGAYLHQNRDDAKLSLNQHPQLQRGVTQRRTARAVRAKPSRALVVATLAMVNVDFTSPSLVLGAALIGCGVLLLQVCMRFWPSGARHVWLRGRDRHAEPYDSYSHAWCSA